jgi:hypothetical protein
MVSALLIPKLTHLHPPKPGGVLDYVDTCLSRQVDSVKVALDEQSASIVTLEGNCLLHYSGYGYSKRGAPLWLLNKLKAERANIKTLGVYFHELYAFGPPWSSAFWLSPIQRHITHSIAEICDYWITNREESALWLRRFAEDKPNALLPCFSTVGEMPSYLPNRLPRIVVFGGAAVRIATYRAAGEQLFIWARAQGLEIHDIGPVMNDTATNDSLVKAGVLVHGRLNVEEVGHILSCASFGLINYPVEYVAKSSVFAAYSAHGICPVLISESYLESDGLIANEHYLVGLFCKLVSYAEAERIGMATFDWYQSHRMELHVSAQLNLSRKVIKSAT